MGKTKISWATHTINPVSGCSKPAAVPPAGITMFEELDRRDGTHTVIEPKWLKDGTSPECVRCYAEELSLRRGWSPKPWQEENIALNLKLRTERFREIKNLPKAGRFAAGDPASECTRAFIASMGDIFHASVPDEFIRAMWDYLLDSDAIFMLLTKRIDRAASWPGPWPKNIWLGTTCGHPMTKWRIEYLRRSLAQTRFVSMEPLLGSMLPLDLTGIDQAIVGGESGNGFRKMNMEWAREVLKCAQRDGAAFFYKQDSAYRTETRPWLVDADGLKLEYHQFPGELRKPILIGPNEAVGDGLHIVE